MVKNRVVYREGTFKDYAGNERKYIVAAVSELMPEKSSIMYIEESKNDVNLVIQDVVKKLSLGFAICSPEDKWNEELGKTIALGKAIKRPARVLYASHTGMINTEVVEAVINQEMRFFESNPGTIIAGYDKSKTQHESKK